MDEEGGARGPRERPRCHPVRLPRRPVASRMSRTCNGALSVVEGRQACRLTQRWWSVCLSQQIAPLERAIYA
jgi:hypothetical protein